MRNGRGTIGLEEEEKKENILLSLQIAVKFHRIIFFTTMNTSLQTQIVV